MHFLLSPIHLEKIQSGIKILDYHFFESNLPENRYEFVAYTDGTIYFYSLGIFMSKNMQIIENISCNPYRYRLYFNYEQYIPCNVQSNLHV